MSELYGGIEAGGTKIVCAVGSDPDNLLAEDRFPTTTPSETFPRIFEFFHTKEREFGKLNAIGVACFGPLDPNPVSPTYGYVTSTPKPGWANFNFLGHLAQEFSIPFGFDTDVDGAVLGEWRWGAGQGLDSLVYLTIGTGIGGGAMANGDIIHGLLHTEMGHMRIPHDLNQDDYAGGCPYHGDCWEGLASGPAIEQRWGKKAETLPANHPAWDLEAKYIADALVNLILVISPQRIILGGGVMSQSQLFPKIQENVLTLLNGYIKTPSILSEITNYIVQPGLGSRAGVLGAIALAEKAFSS